MKKTKLFFPAVALGLLFSLGLTGCGGNQNNSGNNASGSQQNSTSAPQKEKITVTAAGDKKSLELNETVQLSAKVGDVALDGVTWESNDLTVATVDATGKVTAVGYGEATITAKKDGYTNGTIGITVPRPAATATFDLTTAADHYSADGWWELPSSGGMGFAMQSVTGWNPISQEQNWMGGGDEDSDTFIGGFGTGDKETIQFTASKAGKANVVLNVGNTDEANLAEIMSIKLNNTAVSLTGKTLEAHQGQYFAELVFDDVSLGNLDLAASNKLEIEFLQDTNIFLNELSFYAEGMTITLTNPVAKQQIAVASEKLDVIVGQTVAIQTTVQGVSYVSVDPETATVNAAGVVTGVKQGITNITVKKDDMYSVRVEITVKPAPVAGQILVEAEDAEELTDVTPGSFNMNGPSIMQDGGMMGGSEVHSGSAYVMIFGASGELTLTYKFNATTGGTMTLSVVGSAPMSTGGDAAAYVFKDSMGIKLNNNTVTPAATAEFPAPAGYTTTMTEVVLADVTVKSGENTLVITLVDVYPSLDVFKLSVK